MLNVFWLFMAYLIGSIPFGLLIAKTCCGIDPRHGGSGNVGSTNVARLCGTRYGIMTLACDLLKGTIPVCVAMFLIDPGAPVFWTLTALAAIAGHLFSCFLHFHGGKAVATSIGVFIPLAFWQLLVAGLLCVLIIWRTEYVSLGSLTLVTVLPLLLIVSGCWAVLPLALIIMVAVYWSHRENIKRLARGEEKSWLKKA
ncbi:MAG TPA: glycerol-3-phosphate 1-O-acyltransferase PlsY [Candidatus Avidesulfovibrio excrementigallinarum]|nr:glycerol-3-phosphate 1-O-acyltransferase PlsY [Candidatus Avidesulfovibrio excrementigallinarum]